MFEKTLPPEVAERRVCEARRMEIVGQLTGGVVHDFNNILTVITGTIEILEEAVADRADLASIAGLIAEAAARGAGLTSSLLAFARGQPSQPRNVNLNALLADASRLLRPTLGEQIEIDTRLASEISFALVDPSLLMTAILNLAVMARDTMPQGGKLIFEAGNTASERSGSDSEDEVSAVSHVMIAVNASGYGSAAAHDDRALIDLDTINEFVQQSDGHVDVVNQDGRTWSVKIYLPRAASSEVRSPARELAEGGDEAILVVEDDPLVRKYVVSQVRSLGYRTISAGDASEALRIIDNGEQIDLLFTDVVMPGPISGRQLAIAALNRRPGLRVLYTSGYAKNALVQEERLDADVLLLAKPYRKAELAKMIRTALGA
jgi:CheY-like chemotaxis protein